MQQETIQEVIGLITGITHSAEVMILSFQENGRPGAMALTIETPRYHELFPAGDPALGVEMVAVLKQVEENVTLISIYDPKGDFLVTGDFPELAQRNYQIDDENSIDLYADLIADRNRAVEQIEASTVELEALAAEHDAENMASAPEINYGNPVIDQGGDE